jgi:hypothetical protein
VRCAATPLAGSAMGPLARRAAILLALACAAAAVAAE